MRVVLDGVFGVFFACFFQSISHFGITNFIIVVLQLLLLALRPFAANARLYP